MIQRKQSIWLLLAALFNAGVFLFDLYRVDTNTNGVVTQSVLRVSNHYPSLLIALVMTLLPLISIFMFSNRKRQRGMTAVSMVATLAFIGMTLARVNKLETATTPPPTGGTYWIGAVLPVVALVFIVMALAGIRKDEKLVRSMDRLR
jgi:FtsH-binding integral membrane protein